MAADARLEAGSVEPLKEGSEADIRPGRGQASDMDRSSRLLLAISIGLGLALAAGGAASAGTSPCAGKAPAVGAAVHGPVLDVIDGETLCVALGATPDHWVALRLAGLPRAAAPARGQEDRARGVLMAVAFSQNVTCRVVATDRAGASAVCDLDGLAIPKRMQTSGAVDAGWVWR